jgi:hypothetical protein
VHERGDVVVAGQEFGSGHQGIIELEPRTRRASLSSRKLLAMAEGEGFEPSRRCYRLRDFQSRALGQAMRPFQDSNQPSAFAHRCFSSLPTDRLTDWPTRCWRRGWDSNPRRLITSPLFESGTFNHSDTSPTCEVYQRGHQRRRQNVAGDSKTARRLPGGASCYAWHDSNPQPLGPELNAPDSAD